MPLYSPPGGGGAAQFDEDAPHLRFTGGFYRIAQAVASDDTDATYLMVDGGAVSALATGVDPDYSAEMMIHGDGTPQIRLLATGPTATAYVQVDASAGEIDHVADKAIYLTITGGATDDSRVVMTGGKGLVLPSLAADPGTPVEAQIYFNTTSDKIRCWDGAAWQNLW